MQWRHGMSLGLLVWAIVATLLAMRPLNAPATRPAPVPRPGMSPPLSRLATVGDFAPGSESPAGAGAKAIDAICAGWTAAPEKVPAAVVLIGSADRLPLRGAALRRYGDNSGLARARAERVKERLGVCSASIPSRTPVSFLVLSAGPARTPSLLAPLGQPDDRSVQVLEMTSAAAETAVTAGTPVGQAWGSIADWAAVAAAVFSVLAAWQSVRAAEAANRREAAGNMAATFTGLRERFSEIRNDIPWKWIDDNQIHFRDPQGKAALRALTTYWRLAFDEWYVTQKLNPQDLGPLWSEYYAKTTERAVTSDVMWVGLMAAYADSRVPRDAEYAKLLLDLRAKHKKTSRQPSRVDVFVNDMNAQKGEARWLSFDLHKEATFEQVVLEALAKA